jgi:hypothetical protein
MKYLITILSIIFSSSLIGQLGYVDPCPNLNSYTLNGKVKFIQENYEGKLENDQIVKTNWMSYGLTSSKYYFDSLGNLTEKQLLNQFGEYEIKEYYLYQNQKIKESQTKYFNRSYFYDSLNRIVKEIIISPRVAQILLNNQPLKNQDSIVKTEIIYNYGLNGKLNQKIEYGRRTEPNYLAEFKYDKLGRLISERIKYSGSTWETHSYKFDNNSNLLSTTMSDEEAGVIERKTFEYKNHFKVFETIEIYEEKELSRRITIKYENLLPVEITEFDSEGISIKSEKIKYEFDQFGNWIKKTRIINDEEIYILTRKLDYY